MLGTPVGSTQATSGTGTVKISGNYERAGFAVDVDAVLTFPQGDSGASVAEVFQAQTLPGNFTCGALASQ
jgi:hypothetical protein